MADDYSKSNFNAEETSDGASNVQGSYTVALPDGRIQKVTYTSNGYDGYVADVTYEGKYIFFIKIIFLMIRFNLIPNVMIKNSYTSQ